MKPGRDEHIYDLYEDDRPLRFIHGVVWGIIILYLIFVLIGVLTTPIENDRPVMASAEYRQHQRYISTVTNYIEEVHTIYTDLNTVANSFRVYGSSRASEAADSVQKLTRRLQQIEAHLDRIDVPVRFSGVVGGGQAVNNQAFHGQFKETIAILIAYAEEMYRYFTDFDESRWETINSISNTYRARANQAFSLYRRIVGDQPGGL